MGTSFRARNQNDEEDLNRRNTAGLNKKELVIEENGRSREIDIYLFSFDAVKFADWEQALWDPTVCPEGNLSTLLSSNESSCFH